MLGGRSKKVSTVTDASLEALRPHCRAEGAHRQFIVIDQPSCK
jgi:hypothetical protein